MLFFATVLLPLLALLQAGQSAAFAIRGSPNQLIRSDKRALLQDLVTWDEHSIFVRGERILFYSGEMHPFRLPSPDLWLDVLQKVKSLGYNGVSFYVDWALLEGEPGVFRANGIFDLDPFFKAAADAGIYLLARPGPYINAEVSGGGFPGWLQRIKGTLRTNATDFLQATDLYMAGVGAIIARHQITNGGPVILVQPENEYTYSANGIVFPNGQYMAYVEKQLHDAGIVVPLINNDASARGIFAPGNGTGSVDIYGHDSYPLGFDCANPYVWPDNSLPSSFRTLHLKQSPLTPYALVEFQGGSFDPWGGSGFAKCLALVNEQFERVFYKNDFSFGVTIFNTYMVYGGTNWGNLGHPGGYTSYDYGAVIAEDRSVAREKYSEAKLEANFLKCSPAYLTATPGKAGNGSYVDTPAIAVTPLFGNGSATNFYVVRHGAYNSNASTDYTITIPTSSGNITVPQLTTYASALTLHGRDSKIHVSDYDLGGKNLLYSSAEIFTWEKYQSETVLVLYGGENETHEFAVPSSLGKATLSGGKITSAARGSATVVQWQVEAERQVVSFPGLTVYLLWRNEAYNWWALEIPAAAPINNYTSPSKTKVIVKAGYLLRSVSISDSSMYITGDVNTTTTLEVIGGAPGSCKLYFNGGLLDTKTTSTNSLVATIPYAAPQTTLPTLSSLPWHSIDSLPEIQPSYSDALWTPCNHATSNNPLALSTPFSLYASDYGYHTGSLIYRGHFTSHSSSSTSSTNLSLLTQGGTAYAYSIYLNSTHLYSYPGTSTAGNHTVSLALPSLTPSTPYTLTVAVDHMGHTENFNPGADTMKQPRGILSYNITSLPQSAVQWKVTGNLHGESYVDKTRGPLNEGGFFAERMGFHLPSPPINTNDKTSASASYTWDATSPFSADNGLSGGAGVRFYTTTFDLALPSPEYDIPLAFRFTNTTTTGGETSSSTPTPFRAVLYVNGYQFGKYVNDIGPQTLYPVPEGVLNYHGTNTLGLLLWALTDSGARLGGLELVRSANAGTDPATGLDLELGLNPVWTGRGAVANAPMDAWQPRQGAY